MSQPLGQPAPPPQSPSPTPQTCGHQQQILRPPTRGTPPPKRSRRQHQSHQPEISPRRRRKPPRRPRPQAPSPPHRRRQRFRGARRRAPPQTASRPRRCAPRASGNGPRPSGRGPARGLRPLGSKHPRPPLHAPRAPLLRRGAPPPALPHRQRSREAAPRDPAPSRPLAESVGVGRSRDTWRESMQQIARRRRLPPWSGALVQRQKRDLWGAGSRTLEHWKHCQQ
mmetsp:Transcript_87059/g.281032  ORF Transcript_87059/g.281032 Transcript_87059/m.281032 type:complete len:225 (+) Transcript_87059:1196-1870(+)